MKLLDQNVKIAGLSVITTNRDMQAPKDIGALWKRFFEDKKFTEAVQGGIDIYAVYDQYENKEFGNYRVTIGCNCDFVKELNSDVTIVKIEKGEYECLPAPSRSSDHIVETWQKVWNNPSLKRSYATDFELYSDENIEINVGVLRQ